jgi:hypothetical protein
VEARGARLLAFLGDTLRLPSTGLAVTAEMHHANPELVAGMVGVYRRAMDRIFDDDQAALQTVLRDVFNQPAEHLDQAVQLIRHCYNPAGHSHESLLQDAIDGFSAGLGTETRAAAELYDFQYLPA